MGSAEGLDVVVGIPVGVIDDDGVGSGEIDAETAGSGRKEKDELLRIWCW